jgi:hypothetical protein
MKTLTRILRLFNLDSDAHRRRVGERQAGAARLGGAKGASRALKTASWTLAVVLALGTSLVHAQVPTCAAPGCNSVTSDSAKNTAVGTGTLVSLTGGFGSNTALGYQALNQNTTGSENTAMGELALFYNTGGSNNTALGFQTLVFNSTGGNNTASGSGALFNNFTGNNNTASGYFALDLNTNGNNNTASGVSALENNDSGSNNTASGTKALWSNKSGIDNTASGMNALFANFFGSANTADGFNALHDNQGGANTGTGFQALNRNTYGNHNTAAGYNAVFANTTGDDNTGVGYLALNSNTTGLNNIALGANAGYAVTGSNNIDIGNQGFAADAGTIRIGAPSTQSKAFVAGIYGTPLTGSAVYVTSSGQLGVLGSSERFKTDIAPMPELSDKLKRLRPVTFRYKTDPQAIPQYGLIAEEVDQVYPELVIRDEAGKIQGVRYEELAPMLLNEVQQQAAEIRDLKQQVAEMNNLKLEMRAALVALKSKDQLIAQR